MKFTTAQAIEQVCYQMRLGDYLRGQDRGRILSLANGTPPYTAEEAERNKKNVNFNDLTLTRITHDARLQVYQAFFKPGAFFRANTDMGAVQKRQERSTIVTTQIARIMKRSNPYFECQRAKFGQMILHGIGPGTWEDGDRWCPIPIDIADVLLPANTLLTMRNLPFFAIWRGYTANELQKLTRIARLDKARNPGWNLPVVDRAIAWADKETAKLNGSGTPNDYWVPEKMVERLKQDGGIYASDRAATISCWDFYFLDDAGRREGLRRRIVFDAYGGAGAWDGPNGYNGKSMPSKNLIEDPKSDFLFSSGNRVVADKWSEVLHFQFADLSAKFPAMYHSTRGIGFMLYAPCHLQNRLNCGWAESVFEQLLNYMRVNSGDEAERALKIELIDRGIIDESVHFLSPAERWQPNADLIGLGMSRFRQIINENSSSYMQNRDLSHDRVEKTKFQVMSEIQTMQTLLSAGLQQTYRYQEDEYREIFRRFMQKNSSDPDVIEFRARALMRGVPERFLTPDAWDIQAERIMGGGSKTLELAAAQQLMEWRSAFGPEAQQRILKKATLAVLDDAAETELLVPTVSSVSASRHGAAVAYGSLMAGAVISRWPASYSLMEVTETLLGELGQSVTTAAKQGGMVSMDKFTGYQNVLKHLGDLLAEVSKDDANQERAKELAQTSGKIANLVKGFGQRLAEQMKAQGQEGGNGEMETAKAKAAAMVMQAKVKAEVTKESHAQRTAQRQVQSEMEMDRAEQKHQMEMRHEAERIRLENEALDIDTAASVRRDSADAAVQRQIAKKNAEEAPAKTDAE
jgi:hypothetical protein